MVIAFTAGNFRFTYSTHLGVMCHIFIRCEAAFFFVFYRRPGSRGREHVPWGMPELHLGTTDALASPTAEFPRD